MLERFRSRAAGARAPGIEFLGRGDAPGRACFFFRAGDSDIVLECVPREQASRCCREGGRVAVVSHVFPSTGAPEGIGPSIPWLAGRLLEREGDILADIRSHVDDELPASSGADVPLGGGRLGFVRIGPRGTLCLDLAAWSFRLLPPASGAEDDRAVQAALLALAARLLAQRSRGIAETVEVIHLDLARPDACELALSRRASSREIIPAGTRLRLMVDVPSVCLHDCVFCDARDRPWSPVPAALPVLDRLLPRLEPLVGSAVGVDVNLQGDDALNSPELFDILDTFSRLRPDARFSVISPGTRLADPAFVESVAAAGIRSFVMTLFGPGPEVHDRIAGRDGAFVDLMAAIGHLDRLGLERFLRTVVVPHNLGCFGQILDLARSLGARPEVTLLDGRSARSGGTLVRLSDFVAVLEAEKDRILATVSSLALVPVCVLPGWAAALLQPQPYRDADEPMPDCCVTCSAARSMCASVSAAYLAQFGPGGLRPLPS